MKKPTSPRLLRTIQALIKGPITSYDLRNVAGQLNAPDLVYRLRRLGLMIHTKLFKFRDRDGRTVNPCRYFLDPNCKETAENILAEQQKKGVAVTTPAVTASIETATLPVSQIIKSEGGAQ